MKTAIFFFSGTGNTFYISKQIQDQLSKVGQCDLYAIEKNDIDANLIIEQYDLIGLGYPIYGSCLPEIVYSWIESLHIFHKPAFTFCTQLMYSGDGAAHASRYLAKKGFVVNQQEHFNMPNNIIDISLFVNKKPYKEELVVHLLNQKVNQFCQSIIQKKKHRKGSNILSLLMGLVQRIPYQFYEKNRKERLIKVDLEKCIRCGICYQVCPVHHYLVSNDPTIQDNKCISCYRCINHCPTSALTLFGRKIRSIPYLGPTSTIHIEDWMNHHIEDREKPCE